MKTIVIADCHGRPDLIENVLVHSNYNRNSDHLIFAGDIVDVGTRPLECLEILIRENAELLWGNHDVAARHNLRIWPYNWPDENFLELLKSHEKEFKLATFIGNVLVTHAGLSFEHYLNLLVSENISVSSRATMTAEWCSEQLNEIPILNEYNDRAGVLWYRPSKTSIWYSRIPQIVGHTPLEYAEKCVAPFPLSNFYIVDPYHSTGFGEDRYRYAIINDSGDINIVDSLDK